MKNDTPTIESVKPKYTRAQLLRMGKIDKGNGKMTGFERMYCFKFRLSIIEEVSRNGIVSKRVDIKKEPFIDIKRASHFIENLSGGYKLEVIHNPKKWLVGTSSKAIGGHTHPELYDVCESIENAIDGYNKRNGGQ